MRYVRLWWPLGKYTGSISLCQSKQQRDKGKLEDSDKVDNHRDAFENKTFAVFFCADCSQINLNWKQTMIMKTTKTMKTMRSEDPRKSCSQAANQLVQLH